MLHRENRPVLTTKSAETSQASEWQKHRLTTAPKPILWRRNRREIPEVHGGSFRIAGIIWDNHLEMDDFPAMFDSRRVFPDLPYNSQGITVSVGIFSCWPEGTRQKAWYGVPQNVKRVKSVDMKNCGSVMVC